MSASHLAIAVLGLQMCATSCDLNAWVSKSASLRQQVFLPAEPPLRLSLLFEAGVCGADFEHLKKVEE